MSFSHGKNAVFSIDNGAGTLQSIKAGLNSVSGLPGARGLSETTAFGDAGTRSIPSLENTTFSVAGMFDTAATIGTATVLNSIRNATATSTFEYGPEGTATGAVKYTGECWMTGLTVDASNSERVPIAATFQVDGVVTVTTY